jgi:diadenosine tetraphosphate (Ap4A) HIT family hydrolase
MPFVIIVVSPEHKPIWQLSSDISDKMTKSVNTVSTVIHNKYNLFPNYFTGGNIANGKYGLLGVHAHVHIEPRNINDPEYNTFPGHRNKKFHTDEELSALKLQWKLYLNIE